MSIPVEAEIFPRASIDTVIGERPPTPKLEGNSGQEARQTVVAAGCEAQSTVTSPGPEALRTLRLETLPREDRIEWENIRTQLGISDVEEGRLVDWEQFRNQLGLSDEDEGSTSLLKQIGQACLVLATTPFMLSHGVFKMLGALFRSLGMIFTGLAKLSQKLTYKPKKGRDRQATGSWLP